MEHAKFDAKVANALLSAGREIVDARGGHTSPFAVSLTGARLNGLHAPYTLADPAPLADEQAEAANAAGARLVNDKGWEVESGYCARSYLAPLNGKLSLVGGPWYIAPDPSRAAEDEPVTFDERAAHAATVAGCRYVDVMGTDGGYRFVDGYQPTAKQVAAVVKAEPGRLCAPYGGGDERLIRYWDGIAWTYDDATLTAANPDTRPELPWKLAIRPDYKPVEGSGYTPGERQCVAVEDEPQSVTLEREPQDVRVTLDRDETSVRLYVNGRLFVPYGDGPDAPIPRDVVRRMVELAYLNGCEDGLDGEGECDPLEDFERMALEDMGVVEEEQPFGEPETQDTLTACMRWCDDRDQGAWVRRSGFPLRIGKIESDGQLYLERYASLGAQDFARPMELSTDEGRTWFSPSKGPEVEPKSGAELRRWLVSNPDREARRLEDNKRFRFGSEHQRFEVFRTAPEQWSGANAIALDADCVPADGGTWGSEGE